MASNTIYDDPNGVPMQNGKTIHMDLGVGDVANRILTVGSPSRAEKIAAFLDNEPAPSHHTSGRGFTTITGKYKGVPVSIIAIGMGLPMMDFFVRETKAVVEGQMVVVRFGTCGGLRRDINPGAVVVASEGSALIQRNPDVFLDSSLSDTSPYFISRVTPADAEISQAITQKLQEAFVAQQVGAEVVNGINVTADGFYATQGRLDAAFDDRNEGLIAQVMERYPSAASMEMESFQLLHLAACSRGTIRASAAAIALANRHRGDVITDELLHSLEAVGGQAILEALITIPIGDQVVA